MRKSYAILLYFIVSFGTISGQNQKLTVIVKNIQNVTNKNLFISVFNAKGNFPNAQYLNEQILKVNNKTCTVLFDVPYGEYAISVFHDINGNGKLDKNLFGAPKEPYGFSQNFKPTFSQPKFDDCRFVFNETNASITINLIH
jgi:uncharacterized protein (DUF2141 family)